MITGKFSPASLGISNLNQSVLSILLSVSMLRYEFYLLHCDKDLVQSVVRFCILLVFGSSLICFIAIKFMSTYLNLLLQVPTGLSLILPISLMFSGISQIANNLATRNQEFLVCSKSKVMQSIGFNSCAISSAFLSPTPLFLIVSDSFGRLLQMLTFLKNGALIEMCRYKKNKYIDWSSIKAGSRGSMLTMPAALLSVACTSLQPILLVAIFSPHEAGIYAFVERIIGGPIALLGNASAQVYTASLVGAEQNIYQRKALYFSLLKSQSITGFLIFIAILSVAFFIPESWFGSKWNLVPRYALYLSPMFVSAHLHLTFNMTLVMTGCHLWQFVWDAARTAALILTWVAIKKLNANSMIALITISLIYSFGYLAHIVMSYYAIDRLSQKPSAT